MDQLVSNQASIIYLSSFSEIEIFHTVNSLVVISSTWLISLRKFDVFLKVSQTYIKHFLKNHRFQICAYFFSSFSACWVITTFWFFTNSKLQNISKTPVATCWQKLAAKLTKRLSQLLQRNNMYFTPILS